MKKFRVGEYAVGPDYKCSKCGLTGHRLWRQSHVMLDHIELMCAVCAEADQKEQIARYANFHQEWECTIGDLLPARPTPEGDTFWGHTSGDVDWWYTLPQYADPAREMTRLRIERDHFRRAYTYEAEAWLKEWRKVSHAAALTDMTNPTFKEAFGEGEVRPWAVVAKIREVLKS